MGNFFNKNNANVESLITLSSPAIGKRIIMAKIAPQNIAPIRKASMPPPSLSSQPSLMNDIADLTIQAPIMTIIIITINIIRKDAIFAPAELAENNSSASKFLVLLANTTPKINPTNEKASFIMPFLIPRIKRIIQVIITIASSQFIPVRPLLILFIS